MLAPRAALLVGLLLAPVVLLVALTSTGRYLVRAAWEEGRILARRRSIVALVAAPATDPRTRAKLRFVLEARAFAEDSVGLRAGGSFTTFSQLAQDTLVLVLSAAPRDRLTPYTWWFPIVGRVPYKGFFDRTLAVAAERDLQGRGFDTYLRPSPAFSTLGWLDDPLLSTTLAEDSIGLATTVAHELTHSTFYAPGQAVFNESFANFVGARASAWLFRARGNGAAAAEAEARWEDEKALADFWGRLHAALESAFASHPDDARRRLALRDSIYTAARRELVDTLAPRLRTVSPRYAERVQLDNAALLARRIYLTRLDLFDAVLAKDRGDLRRAVADVIAAAKAARGDPYGGVRRWLSAAPEELPASRRGGLGR